eukprot:2364165-Amphidinium_carterae.2
MQFGSNAVSDTGQNPGSSQPKGVVRDRHSVNRMVVSISPGTNRNRKADKGGCKVQRSRL